MTRFCSNSSKWSSRICTKSGHFTCGGHHPPPHSSSVRLTGVGGQEPSVMWRLCWGSSMVVAGIRDGIGWGRNWTHTRGPVDTKDHLEKKIIFYSGIWLIGYQFDYPDFTVPVNLRKWRRYHWTPPRLTWLSRTTLSAGLTTAFGGCSWGHTVRTP